MRIMTPVTIPFQLQPFQPHQDMGPEGCLSLQRAFQGGHSSPFGADEETEALEIQGDLFKAGWEAAVTGSNS